MKHATSDTIDKFIDDPWEFHRQVGSINFRPLLKPLGLEPFSVTGAFDESDAEELQEFCQSNSGYHIVSLTPSLWYLNRYVPGCRLYLLAEGDANPALRSHLYLNKGLELFLEDGAKAALSVIAKINGSADA